MAYRGGNIRLAMQVFTASRLSDNDNTIYPDRLEIDDRSVLFYKGYVFGYRKTVIYRRHIAAIYADAGLFFANIHISSTGNGEIVARGFKKADARKIVDILTR